MYVINIADKKMLREMVREAMEKGGLDQTVIMSDLREELKLL